ncbi:hypothetical protein PHMEG_00023653 [Phytophthora megakarya]|uniref:Transmembrane protein n=1 Tax=Phytophthora megakarya TaxID=4795 RepID=A0A225VGB3_9STRA|nr:hypothetical protein PHMEG_00023653 [Phytophthora megakarya]
MSSKTTTKSGENLSGVRTITLVWMTIGLGPLFLQIKGYAQFVTPHKISDNLISPIEEEAHTSDLHQNCPVNELFMAGAYWNVNPTHYYHILDGVLCHYVMPQYNLHGNYYLGNYTVEPYRTTPSSCAEQSYPFTNYFYHGSIGYYSFYAEGEGTYCALDDIAYDVVRGVGTLDINGVALANDKGRKGYLRSYWYAFAGFVLVGIRCAVLRRSFIMCKRFARRCDHISEPIRLHHAVVFVQESMRLSAHGAKNYHRVLLLFLLLDQGLMSDLFLLITQEGFVGRIQCISLGYNLAGIMSMLFEIVQSMKWMGHRTEFLVKRLLFNYETALIGELITAAVMQYYLTTLNRSGLRNTEKEALEISYYVMSLVGHGVIALGCVFVIVCTRSLGATGFVLWTFKTLRIFLKPCSVDATLGVRTKLVLLGGYVMENGELFYKSDTLKAFGLLRTTDEDGNEFLVYSKLRWISIPRDYLYVCGTVLGVRVSRCEERQCSGVMSIFDQALGGRLVGDAFTDFPGAQHCIMCHKTCFLN